MARLALSRFSSRSFQLMPVVGLKELHLDASKDLFHRHGHGSVAAAVCVMPLARAPFAKSVDFYANLLLVLNLFLIAFVNWPHAFCSGRPRWRGVDTVTTELWIAAQRAMLVG
jgi:hypothetical protein